MFGSEFLDKFFGDLECERRKIIDFVSVGRCAVSSWVRVGI